MYLHITIQLPVDITQSNNWELDRLHSVTKKLQKICKISEDLPKGGCGIGSQPGSSRNETKVLENYQAKDDEQNRYPNNIKEPRGTRKSGYGNGEGFEVGR